MHAWGVGVRCVPRVCHGSSGNIPGIATVGIQPHSCVDGSGSRRSHYYAAHGGDAAAQVEATPGICRGAWGSRAAIPVAVWDEPASACSALPSGVARAKPVVE